MQAIAKGLPSFFQKRISVYSKKRNGALKLKCNATVGSNDLLTTMRIKCYLRKVNILLRYPTIIFSMSSLCSYACEIFQSVSGEIESLVSIALYLCHYTKAVHGMEMLCLVLH